MLQIAQLRCTYESKLKIARANNKKLHNEKRSASNSISALQKSLRTSNLQISKLKNTVSELKDVLEKGRHVYEYAVQKKYEIEKNHGKELVRRDTVNNHLQRKSRELQKAVIDKDKQARVASQRAKRISVRLTERVGEVGKSRQKRVPVSQLAKKSQAKKRREQYCEEILETAKKRAELQQIDDASSITIDFDGWRPMKLVFAEAGEGDDDAAKDGELKEEEHCEEEGEGNSIEISDDDIRRRVRKALAIADKKGTSITSIRTFNRHVEGQNKFHTQEYVGYRNELNNDLAKKFKLAFDRRRAEVDVDTYLRDVIIKRGLKDKKSIRVLIAGDGRSIKCKHHSLAMYFIVIEEGRDCGKHTHVYQVGIL